MNYIKWMNICKDKYPSYKDIMSPKSNLDFVPTSLQCVFGQLIDSKDCAKQWFRPPCQGVSFHHYRFGWMCIYTITLDSSSWLILWTVKVFVSHVHTLRGIRIRCSMIPSDMSCSYSTLNYVSSLAEKTHYLFCNFWPTIVLES